MTADRYNESTPPRLPSGEIDYDHWVRKSNATPGGSVDVGNLSLVVTEYYRGDRSRGSGLTTVETRLQVSKRPEDEEGDWAVIADVPITAWGCLEIANAFLMMAMHEEIWPIEEPDDA